MRLFFLFIFIPIFFATAHSQTVTKTRTAVLMDGTRYEISGNAILEELSNGNLQLRLDDDFATPAGPDVRIYLSDDPNSISNSVEVENIGTGGRGINHFSGAITFDLPASTGIDEFNHIVFYCVAFGLHWASGDFDELEGDAPTTPTASECQETIAATTNWGTEVTICPNDGVADDIPLLNTVMIPAGDTYAYILTDDNNRIQEVILEGSYNFEGSGLGTNRVYGISYSGELNYTIGDALSSITADGCAILSNTDTFLTVLKQDCNPSFECQETTAATTNWNTAVTICESDGVADPIPLLNTLMIPAGDNYAYIITDENDRIEEVVFEGSYDFENSGLGINRVYGVSFDTNLDYTVGNPLSSITADGCLMLSNSNTFLTVTKVDCTPAFECQETTTSTNNSLAMTICESDGVADRISLTNSLNIPAGDNYAYVITDESDRIVDVVFEDSYDFESSGLGVNRVYGVSFDTNLNFTVGNPLSSITADGCLMLSNSNTFLTITKVDCTPVFECQETTTSTNNSLVMTICESDGVADRISLTNSLNIPAGDNYAYVITDESDRIVDVVFEDSYDFESSGLGVNRVYGVSFDTNLNFTVGNPLSSITADGCLMLSNSNTFLTVTKVDCTPAFECQTTTTSTANNFFDMNICESDGVADIIPLVNSLNIPAGDNYAYIITDENNQIEEVIFEDSYNFEGSGFGVNRVYGVSFDTNLNFAIGSPLSSVTADGCFILSSNTGFLSVFKEDCTPAFECQATTISTTDGVSNISICEGDGMADRIPLLNSLSISAGDNYAYIITDENNQIEEVIFEDSYDFEGSGLGVNRVYGISFDANLNFAIGNQLSSITADGCAILSNNTFLSVTKESCSTVTATISGKITNQAGNGLEGFQVSLGNSINTTTDADGFYEFRDLPTNATYEITPTENSNISAGVTTFDLVLIKRHILRVDLFENAFQTIAADANNDSRVTTIDLVELTRIILGLNSELPNNQSWRFLNMADANSDTLDPSTFSESIIVSELSTDTSNINFLGVKVGDVSGSTSGLLNSTSRSISTLQFNAADALVEAGQIVEIPITAENFDQILAYQFTMNLVDLEFVDLKAGVLDIDKSNFAQLNAQTITTLWSNDQALSTEETLFTLVVKSLSDIQISDALSFTARATPALAYKASGNSMEVGLAFQAIETATVPTNLFQNEPNPFKYETNIGFNLAKEGTIKLTVFDATGRTVLTQTGEYPRGKHQINLSNIDAFPSGVLYYQLSTADFQATKKMIRL